MASDLKHIPPVNAAAQLSPIEVFAMLSPVLIAYSTRTGSTFEVAEAVATVLRQSRLTVDVTRMRDVKTLDQYGTVILGMPIYLGEFPKEVHQFVNRFSSPLSSLSSWLFVLGPVAGKADQFGIAANQVRRELAPYPWFRPTEIKILGGRFDIDALPFPFSVGRRLVPSQFKGVPNADIRNWNDINTWATLISWRIKPIPMRLAELELAPQEMPIGIQD
jgi:menaquinone-dependent protoporphyrinogen oxidase